MADTVPGGLEPFAGLLTDSAVTDILINGGQGVWIDRGEGLRPVAIDLGGPLAVRQLACRLATQAGRRLDDASPAVDAPLAGSLRMHAVLPPVAPGGPLISLRVVRRRAFTLAELQERGTLSPIMSTLLSGLVAGGASFLVTGATGSGKTTLLSSLLSQVSPDRRIVLVEETGELSPSHPHVVRLEERPANVEGAGAVDLAVLVRQCLRMRPDVVVLGECRGGEVIDVLRCLNTGHQGAATMHANSAQDTPARLAALGALAGMNREAVDAQAGAGLDAVIHLVGGPTGRRVAQIAAIALDSAGMLRAVPAVSIGPTGRLERGDGYQALAQRCGW